MAVKKDPRTLELAEPFVSLFPVDPAELKLVTNSIRERGYDIDKPVLVWRDAFGERGRQVIVDGHTRLRAVLDLKLPEIQATVRQFKDVDAAITAAIGEQVQRRNLNREQIAAYVVGILPLLDPHVRGGLANRTGQQLAEMLGVGVATVKRARALYGSGRTDLIDAVKNGELSLLAAYTESTGATPARPVSRAEFDAVVERLDRDHGNDPVASDDPIADADSSTPRAESRQPAETVEQPVETVEGPAAPLSPDDWLNLINYQLAQVMVTHGDLRELAIGATVKAVGVPGTFKIAAIKYDASGDAYALNSTEKKRVAMWDISEVVRVPQEGS